MKRLNQGVFFYNGMAVDEDKVEAVKYYRMAAEQGYAPPQLNLGNCFYNSEGVNEDKVGAVKCYRMQDGSGAGPYGHTV